MATDKRIHYVGQWPDGTPKLADGTGKVLPQGTSFKIVGNSTIITNPAGQPVQYQHGHTVGAPIEKLTDLPSGSYDPGLLYQSQNANLGQLYGTQDYNTQWGGQIGEDGKIKVDENGRPVDGYKLDANGQIIRPGDLSSAPRGIADYFRNVDRENENYRTATGDLNTSYQRLGQSQLQGINAAGALSGGALAQALTKRTANQAHDQSALDTTHGRTLADYLTGTTRSHADDTTTLGRQGESNALYQGGLFGTATAQANESGMLVDNPNYETHNGVIYSVSADGTTRPVSKVTSPFGAYKPAARPGNPNGSGGATYTPPKVNSPFGGYKPKTKRKPTGGGALAP